MEAGEGLAFFTQAERTPLRDLSLDGPKRLLEQCEKGKIQVYGYEDPRYPQPLREIYDPPAALYVRGNLPDFADSLSLAIVGRRQAGDRGMENARRFAHVLSAHGFIIEIGRAHV